MAGPAFISLISKQTIPNLLLIKELSQAARHIFISTEQMETADKSNQLKTAAGLKDEIVDTIVVESDSLADVQQKLDQLNFKKEDTFIVNITGGTKLMSIGVYNYFRDKNCEMYYIYIGKNVYRKVFPDVKIKEKPFQYRLTLKEYLTGYGIQILNAEKTGQLTKPADYTNTFFKQFQSFNEFDKSVLRVLRIMRHRKKKSIKLEQEEANLMLRRWKFKPNERGILSRDEIEYLTGDWFEEYIYSLFKKELGLSDDETGTGVKIIRDEVQNEFDVLFVHNQTLFVIECKTGLWDSQGERNILNDTLYKIDALSTDFGLRVRPFLFVLTNRGEEKYQIKESSIKRAEHFGVEIISHEDLTDPQFMRNFFSKIS